MYVHIILIFSGAVCIHAQSGPKELCHIFGCFDSGDTQLCMTMNGDEVYYADFKKESLVWDSRLPISFHVSGAYKYAQYYRSICKHDMKVWKPDKSAPPMTAEKPEIIIYPKDEVIQDEENTLICFVNRFFPSKINIKWTKNEKEVSVEDSFMKCLPNSDGTFYVLSTLDFVPKEGDIYGCTVEHESLETPSTRFWEVDTKELSIGPAVFCGLGLSLGLVGVAAGISLYVNGKRYQSIPVT